MRNKPNSSFLHKAAEAVDNASAFLFFTSPVWLGAIGVAAGVMLAPVVGVGAIAAAVVGGVAGFAGGAMGYMAMGSEGNWRLPLPANIVVRPVAALGDKLYTKALAQEIPAADKVRLKDAFNKSVTADRATARFVNSGGLYANVALTVRNGQGTIDSSVKALEAKTYPLQVGTYKP